MIRPAKSARGLLITVGVLFFSKRKKAAWFPSGFSHYIFNPQLFRFNAVGNYSFINVV